MGIQKINLHDERIGEKGTSLKNEVMEIIAYRNFSDIDVLFEDGTIVLNKSYKDFKKGNIRNPNYYLKRVGEKTINRQGMELEIIRYGDSLDIDVKFSDGTIVKNRTYPEFERATIINHNIPEVYGAGFLGFGKYDTSHPAYIHWSGMIQRTCDEKYKNKHQAYKNCTAYDEWLCYQSFGKWFDENYYEIYNERMELDKDILVKGNSIYSPKTCVFVPRMINVLFTKRQNHRGTHLIGVIPSGNKYRSRISINKKSIDLGTFDTEEEAFYAYKTAKENYVKEVADKYKDKIPNILYNALYDYEVEITD